jgi:AcrR family transcriptional regulator
MIRASRTPTTGRKHLSVEKNRKIILKATQQGLANHGPDLTMAQIAAASGMTQATIYNHFESRDQLLTTAMTTAFEDWAEWVFATLSGLSDPLELLVSPVRCFVLLGKTHPIYASMIHKNIAASYGIIQVVSAGFKAAARELVERGVLPADDLDERMSLFSACVFQILMSNLEHPGRSTDHSDQALAISLSLIGLSPATARKLTSQPLPFNS